MLLRRNLQCMELHDITWRRLRRAAAALCRVRILELRRRDFVSKPLNVLRIGE